jgi:hypothetical protein
MVSLLLDTAKLSKLRRKNSVKNSGSCVTRGVESGAKTASSDSAWTALVPRASHMESASSTDSLPTPQWNLTLLKVKSFLANDDNIAIL